MSFCNRHWICGGWIIDLSLKHLFVLFVLPFFCCFFCYFLYCVNAFSFNDLLLAIFYCDRTHVARHNMSASIFYHSSHWNSSIWLVSLRSTIFTCFFLLPLRIWNITTKPLLLVVRFITSYWHLQVEHPSLLLSEASLLLVSP